MNRTHSLCFALGLSACATAPAKNDEAQGPKAEDYAPVRVGAAWTYEVKYPGQTGQMTVYYTKQDAEGFVLDDRNGSWKHTSSGLRDKERYLIMNPLTQGHSWSARVGPTVKENFEVESVGQECSVPAGAFADCLVIHSWIEQGPVVLHIRWTWAKGVGLAAFDTSIQQTGAKPVPQTSQRLIHYALEGQVPPEHPANTVNPPTPSKAQPKEAPPSDWVSE